MEPLTDAQRKLVEENLWLVGCITNAIHTRLPGSVERDDVEQAGRMGLIEAALKFDAQAYPNTLFTTYARWRINGAIRDYLRSLDMASREQRKKIAEGEASEIVALRIEDMHREPRVPGPTPEELSIAAQITAQISTLIDSLGGRRRTIVREYYFREETMAQIGKNFGVKEARISQVHKAAIEQLREEPAFVAHKAVFRFAMNSGMLSLLALVFAFAPAADAQTSAAITSKACKGNTVQVSITVPLSAGAITVPVPVCAELGAGLTLNTAVTPPRLEATAPVVAIPRAVVQRFTLPAALPPDTKTISVNLTHTPAATSAIAVAFRSSRATGDVVDFVAPGGGANPKLLQVTVPEYRPFTADDVITVLYWTLE